MRFGVLGLGVMGQLHAKTYNNLGSLSAVCDISQKLVESTEKAFNVKGYTDVSVFLDNVDAVSIVVPTPYHFYMVKLALEKQKHVLVEKPMALTLSQAEQMKSWERHGKVLTVGYIERYNPAFQALKKLVDTGWFGQVTSINIRRVGGQPRSANSIVLDLMTHDLDILLNIFGKYPSKISTVSCTRDNIVDTAQVLLDFGTASATCEANWISPIKIRTISVTGTNGYCEVDLIKREVKRIKNGLMDDSLSVPGTLIDVSTYAEEPLKNEISSFISAVNGNSVQLVTPEQAYDTLKLTLEAESL